jgi:hypothetical protein
MKRTFFTSIILLVCIAFFLSARGLAQNSKAILPGRIVKKLTLEQAAMCEEIKEYTPYNSAVVFSIKIGKVSCFTSFDPVPEKTFIYHKWYHRDKPSTKKKMTLNPPRWSTYSSILLRETDKGPWRVEISDQKGNLLQILRFSITD